MATPATALSAETKLEDFYVKDLIISLQQSRIIYEGKECQADWNNQSVTNVETALTEKEKVELAKAFDEQRVFYTGEMKQKKSNSVSSNLSAAQLQNHPLFSSLIQTQSHTIDVTKIFYVHKATLAQYTLNITALTPDQKPLLVGSTESAAAPATAAAKPSK